MSRPLTNAALASLFAPETDQAWLILLTIDHADLAAPIRVVNNTQDVVSNGDTYTGCPFRIELPQERDDQPPDAKIQIDNVDRAIVQAIRSIGSGPTATLNVIASGDPDTVEAGPFAFTLKDAQWDAATVTGRLAFEPVLNEPYPALAFTPQGFPGLF